MKDPLVTNGSVVTSSFENQPVQFFVFNQQDEIQKYHYAGSFYEVEELSIIRRYVPEGATILDIGTNIGNHAIFFEKVLKAKEVIVIEPNPIAIHGLKINLALNNCQHINQDYLGIGLANGSFRAEIRIPENNLGGAFLEASEDKGAPVEKGDKFFSRKFIDFIKIDVEGLEIDVLNGLARTIEKNRPSFFIEVLDRNVEQFKQWVAENDYETLQTYRRYAVNENYFIVPAESPLTVQGVTGTGNV